MDYIKRSDVLDIIRKRAVNPTTMVEYIKGISSVDIKAIPAVEAEPVANTFCSVIKDDKKKCSFHNLQCAYPSCCAPQDQSARIAELEAQVNYFKNLLGEAEAQLARFEVVGYTDNACVGTISKHMIDDLKSRGNGEFPYHLWPKQLFAIKESK